MSKPNSTVTESEEDFLEEIKEIFNFLQELFDKVQDDPDKIEIEFSMTPKKIVRFNRVFKKLANEYNKLSNNLEFTVENVLGVDYDEYINLLEKVSQEDWNQEKIKKEVKKLISESKKYMDLTDNKKPAQVLKRRMRFKGLTFDQMVDDQNGLN